MIGPRRTAGMVRGKTRRTLPVHIYRVSADVFVVVVIAIVVVIGIVVVAIVAVVVIVAIAAVISSAVIPAMPGAISVVSAAVVHNGRTMPPAIPTAIAPAAASA